MDDDRSLATDAERVALLDAAVEAADRLAALAAVLAAETDAYGADVTATGLPVVSLLSAQRRMTRREGWALLGLGRDLRSFPDLTRAALAGEASPAQVRAITRVLADLPDDLDAGERARAEAMMVGFAAEFDAKGLSTLSGHLLEVIAPEVVDRLEAERLEREERLARRNRELSFTDDGHGTVKIRGRLPVLQAQTLIEQINAMASAEARRALDALDPLAEEVTPTMRRADALVALAEAAAAHQDAPAHGGDRPRIVVTMPHERLADLAAGARLVGPDQPISAGELRRLCCDADLVPVVLGAESEVLDVGREHRLVTAPIRTALNARDRGCVFPGCDKPPTDCHAHHIVPWQAGGATSLDNLVSVCAHHHRIVEPTTAPADKRWQIRLGNGGIPEVLPPVRVDPEQRPRRHQRFRIPRAEAA
ncbi:HNH endonuclease signature motif containing protein [Raineyella antarctica]|uniref:HNH endonuclease signature motif containing protein n=1 Tax=Raineyella antarctica TaxID=1577474 RepID=UPI001C319633|nr:HNH endonuclease signature motif containing protein [Raineyella antarctica]